MQSQKSTHTYTERKKKKNSGSNVVGAGSRQLFFPWKFRGRDAAFPNNFRPILRRQDKHAVSANHGWSARAEAHLLVRGVFVNGEQGRFV